MEFDILILCKSSFPVTENDSRSGTEIATEPDTAMWMTIPAIFFSRIFRHRASALRCDQFSILVLKLRKKRYSFMLDILSSRSDM